MKMTRYDQQQAARRPSPTREEFPRSLRRRNTLGPLSRSDREMAPRRYFFLVVSSSSDSDAGRMEAPAPKQLLTLRAPGQRATVSSAAMKPPQWRVPSQPRLPICDEDL